MRNHSKMDSRLRVGLLLDSVFLPAWAFAAIERMICSDSAELALVVLNQLQPKRDSAWTKLWQGHWLYRVFNIIDEKLFLQGGNALALVNASEMFSNVPVREIMPVEENGKQHFSPSDIRRIKSDQLDILIKIGFGRLCGDILAVATHGVWTYRWGDSRKIEDGLTSFWEVVRGWPETGAALQQLRADACDVTLFESWLFTYPYSPARSRNSILWAAASFLPRQVEYLHRVGAENYFQGRPKYEDENPGGLQFNGIPSNFMMLWITMKLAFRNLLEIYRRIFCRERWELLFDLSPQPSRDIYAFRKMSPPRDRFWADPHVVNKGPNYYIFVEEYLYRRRKGHISVIEMDREGNYKQAIPVLQENCHFSFPFVFEWMGHYYMIPESSERKTIDLYECLEFPYRWQHKLTLMKDVKAVDTTVVFVEGTWWLFTAIAEQEAAAPQVELFLFFSKELFTNQWSPHPMNPIVSDVRRARGAGRIFQRDGKLIRPSQDCSITYGYGFDLNEIVALSESTYHERTVTSVRPDSRKRILATHTYANQGDLTVVDACTRPPKWANGG